MTPADAHSEDRVIAHLNTYRLSLKQAIQNKLL